MANAQIQQGLSSSTNTLNQSSLVLLNASVSVPISNETIKIKEGMLRSAVISLLNSVANVLKGSDADVPVVKTQIINQINNAIQDIQGTEATNAIIGVEINKALRGKISTSNQSSMITIDTSSNCKPSDDKIISCENSVTIR
jgi:hypothetical protein